VKYQYELPKKLRGLRIGFDLMAQDGTVLWRSFDDDREGMDIRENGLYSAICKIPKNILRPGQYIILVRIGIHNIRWISGDEHTMSFTVANTQGTNKSYVDSYRPGVIMPLLDWRIYKTDE
jgi:hypothetical protein